MTVLLRIDASSRALGSHSREWADYFLDQWQKRHPKTEIKVRDIITQPIPHISEKTITGFYTAKEQQDKTTSEALRLSDELIAELLAADSLLISVPMYNFSIPSALKAYIDQIVRIGHTFGYEPQKGFFGLLKNKKAYVITATGAVFSDGSLSAVNFLEPYLRAVLGLIGITDIEFIAVEGTTMDQKAMQGSKEKARNKIDHLIVKQNQLQ